MATYYKHKGFYKRETYTPPPKSGLSPILETYQDAEGTYFSSSVYTPDARRQHQSTPKIPINSGSLSASDWSKAAKFADWLLRNRGKLQGYLGLAQFLAENWKDINDDMNRHLHENFPNQIDENGQPIKTKTKAVEVALDPQAFKAVNPRGDGKDWYLQPPHDPQGTAQWLGIPNNDWPPPGTRGLGVAGQYLWTSIDFSSGGVATKFPDAPSQWGSTLETIAGVPNVSCWARQSVMVDGWTSSGLLGGYSFAGKFREMIPKSISPGMPPALRSPLFVGSVSVPTGSPAPATVSVTRSFHAVLPMMTPFWAAQVAYADRPGRTALRIALGITQRSYGEPENRTGVQLGTKFVFGGPGAPVKVGYQDPYQPPGPGGKQQKYRAGAAYFLAAQKVFHGITEGMDVINGLFDALPKKVKKKAGKRPDQKIFAIASHLSEIDMNQAFLNISWNVIEDMIIGKGFQKVGNAAHRLGQPQYKFLNSANGFGRLEDLGEGYGEVSGAYISPALDFIKRYMDTH